MYIQLALSCCLHPDSPINILIYIEKYVPLVVCLPRWIRLQQNKFTLYTRNIILSLYAFVVQFIMFVICGIHPPLYYMYLTLCSSAILPLCPQYCT